MDPLYLVKELTSRGQITEKLLGKLEKRIKYLVESVARVEKASGLNYPNYYVSPHLTLLKSKFEQGEVGILFARLIPSTSYGSLSILVEFSAALVALGSKSTVLAVTAHEFTHYVELVRKIIKADFISDEVAASLFELGFVDSEKVIDPKKLFKDKYIISLLSKKFKPGLVDEKLTVKVQKELESRIYPVKVLSPEENVVRLSSEIVSNSMFDQKIVNRIKEFEKK